MGNCQNDHHAQSDDDESISVIKAPIGYGKGGFEKDDLVVAERAEEMYGHYEIEEELGKGAYGSVFKVDLNPCPFRFAEASLGPLLLPRETSMETPQAQCFPILGLVLRRESSQPGRPFSGEPGAPTADCPR